MNTMPRMTVNGKRIVSPASDTINRNTVAGREWLALREMNNARWIVAFIPPAAVRIERAYRQDLARLQAVAA